MGDRDADRRGRMDREEIQEVVYFLLTCFIRKYSMRTTQFTEDEIDAEV